MVTSRAEVIRAISAELANHLDIELCILYGSAAQDNLSRQSDVDLAVGREGNISNDECLELSLHLTRSMQREVSVINIEKMHGVILSEVLTKGDILRNHNPLYLSQFIIKMYEFTEDILPFQLQAIDKKIEKFLHE